MRMLLIISNNNMSLRELYTMMLDNHTAGWITSFMSGLPEDVESIAAGYDAVIYELGPADREDRVAAVRRLLSTGRPVITHLEGRQAGQRAQELTGAGAYVVPNPVTSARIEEVLDAITTKLRRPRRRAPREGIGARFRRLLRGT
ncbi:MAG TPA: hypothetical protein VHB98_00130 [Chloroflexota bacterium]|nr:hypothetical protein [Chloroflexota bacterium]